MHSWGDEWFQAHGKELDEAMDYIRDEYKKRTGRVIHMKEKWGTVRWEYTYKAFSSDFWPIGDYFYPGYLYYQLPKWFMRFDILVGKLLTKLGVIDYLVKKQAAELRKIVNEALRKWPHLKREISCDFGYLLKELK